MEREPQRRQKMPLGEKPKIVRVSKDEMHLAYLHREKTGEPIQTWVRRLIRESWASDEPPVSSPASRDTSEGEE